MENKLLSFLGLVMKSGSLISGEETVIKELKKSNVKLVIAAKDLSSNSKKKVKDKCSFRNVDFVFVATKEDLGKSIGKNFRGIIGITDQKMANKIKDILGGEAFVKDKSL